MYKLDLSFLRNRERMLCQRKTEKETFGGLSGRRLSRLHKSI
jgi:hypothetical protein